MVPWLLTLGGLCGLITGLGVAIDTILVIPAIEHSAGMPLWWTVGDSLACLLFGTAILILEVATRPDGRHGGAVA